MKKLRILAIALIIVSFAAAFYIYPMMPEKVPSHWNVKGEVDGYSSRFTGTFLMPIISLAIFLLMIFLPNIDPLKNNVKKFIKYYDLFMVVMIAFFLYINTLTVLWTLNIRFDMNMMIAPPFALLFLFVSILLKHAKRNWFIGIRTPWTLENDSVWKKTHELGARLFNICALLILIGMIFPQLMFYFMMIPILGTVFILFVYSFIEYKKIKKS